MREFKYVAKGNTPLVTHCNQTADPLNRYAQAMKPLTHKKNKTDQDHRDLARVEWEAGLYLHDGIIVIPADNIDKCLLEAARRTKNGKKWKEGTMIAEDYLPLSYKGEKIKVKENGKIPNPELDKYYSDHNYRALVKNGMSTIARTRPIFYDWSIGFTIMVDENVFDERTVDNIVETAGKYVGLCEKRPRLGNFSVEKK